MGDELIIRRDEDGMYVDYRYSEDDCSPEDAFVFQTAHILEQEFLAKMTFSHTDSRKDDWAVIVPVIGEDSEQFYINVHLSHTLRKSEIYGRWKLTHVLDCTYPRLQLVEKLDG